MDSDDKKKRRERFLLDRFLEHQGIAPARIDQGESPDFLINLDGRTVGIELTELFIRGPHSDADLQQENPPLQAIEAVTDLIVSKAREIYFDANNPPVLAKIVFSNWITPVAKNKGDQIAKLIADQIQTMSHLDTEAATWSSREVERENPLSEWVSFISSYRVPKLRFARWNPISAGLVSNLTPDRLQEAIDKKASKISAYKKQADEIWLLVVADRTRSSQKFSVLPDFPLDSISSPFARTFYYGYISGDVLRFESTKLQTAV